MATVDPDKLTILEYPHPALRKKAKRIEKVDDQVRRVATRMLELMHEAPGVGLAAPQVGLDWRLFVANPTGEPEDDRVFINPQLTELSRETADFDEGCLSLPHITATIRRPKQATISALDLTGQRFTLTSDELPARVWQHEFDHLNAVLILDKMTKADLRANRKAIRDLENDA